MRESSFLFSFFFINSENMTNDDISNVHWNQ